jgi:hypothetical protein
MSPPAIDTSSGCCVAAAWVLKMSLAPSVPIKAFRRPSWVIWVYWEMRRGGSGRRRYQTKEARTAARRAPVRSHGQRKALGAGTAAAAAMDRGWGTALASAGA